MNLLPLPDGNVRDLPSRPAIAKKLFSTWPSPLFYIILLHRQEMVLKIVLWTNFTLFQTSLVLKKREVFLRWKYSGVKVSQSHFKKIIELITLILLSMLSILLFL